MRRRDFNKGISVWTARPLAARAQPREQKRRVDVMRNKTIGIFVTSVALCALGAVIDPSAFARGSGGNHGGAGGHGGLHGGRSESHGAGFHTRASHGGHASSGRSFAAHSRHVGHGGRFASHRKPRGDHSALSAHNLEGAAQGQFASDLGVTHSQFAAQSFHGLNNFNSTGFNRNAFGDAASWNHWAGHFWRVGWNHWGTGWGGWAGPVFWPFLFGDVLTFVLWPYDYYDPFWADGPEFVLTSIFVPGPYFGLDYGYEPDFYVYGGNIYYGKSADDQDNGVNKADREALAETNTEAVQSCGDLAPGVTNLPIEQIRQSVHPTADQESALDDLSAATSQESDIIRSSCPTAVPLTPVGRLDAAEQRLAATITAIQIIRSPFARFYGALSDEQKRQFNAMKASTEGTRSASNLRSLCAQQAGGFVNLPMQRIEQVLQPNEQQRSAFGNLKRAAQNAADQLQSSCPTAVPQSPVARLDAVGARLNTMLATTKSIRPDLESFYASLSDGQKARFNVMGPLPNSASSQPER
jgi:hypothetical protein